MDMKIQLLCNNEFTAVWNHEKSRVGRGTEESLSPSPGPTQDDSNLV